MPVAHAIVVVLLAILAQFPVVAGELCRARSGLLIPVASRVLADRDVSISPSSTPETIPFPANPDRQSHDAIVPSPREEADEWRECEDDEFSNRAPAPGTFLFPPCLPSDEVGPDCPGIRLTRLRARFLLCGRLDC